MKNGITSTKFDVLLTNKEHGHGHSHDQKNEHNHELTNIVMITITDHSHRSYKHIVELIKSAGFSERVEEISLSIFQKIGIAEGKIHGVALEDVHFHEVGAVDSIIDIVGTAILLDQLEIDTIQSSPIPVGSEKFISIMGLFDTGACNFGNPSRHSDCSKRCKRGTCNTYRRGDCSRSC